jgi:hypothetical protein
MNKSVIVYGPQGCGKTLNAQRIAKHFGLTRIEDDYDGSRFRATGTLYLTNRTRKEIDPSGMLRRAVAYADLPAAVRMHA